MVLLICIYLVSHRKTVWILKARLMVTISYRVKLVMLFEWQMFYAE